MAAMCAHTDILVTSFIAPTSNLFPMLPNSWIFQFILCPNETKSKSGLSHIVAYTLLSKKKNLIILLSVNSKNHVAY